MKALIDIIKEDPADFVCGVLAWLGLLVSCFLLFVVL